MLTSIDVNFPSLFASSSVNSGYKARGGGGCLVWQFFFHNRCHPSSSCILAVFAMFLARGLAVSSSEKKNV